MIYKLKFQRKALKEWEKLGEPIKAQFKKKLTERLSNPHIAGDRLKGNLANLYKIKLKTAGYRLVYEVNDGEITVLVLAVGKRERSEVYQNALNRLH
ncbi:addiction module toxin RelE [Haemophilus paracuniculus]|uniref:Addiction module toxin RelE n=1 Tax=Haemophilus paracuniculus TaxID=734 RepID=A0A1T0AR78_9PAST|nr:type II toxin-antitoxin system RelE/ParE family toxin [Haemophilus paracuniculus]OOR98870.1 addiction module toxin RelE [Haemophilus paracuniculus]